MIGEAENNSPAGNQDYTEKAYSQLIIQHGRDIVKDPILHLRPFTILTELIH